MKWHHFPEDRDKLKEGIKYLVVKTYWGGESLVGYCRVVNDVQVQFTSSPDTLLSYSYKFQDFHFIEWEQLDKELSKQ